MQLTLSLLHALDYIFTFSLIGISIFYYLILPAGEKSANDLFSDFTQKFRLISILATLTSVLWFLLVAHDMAESWKASELWAAVSETRFGHIWALKILLLASLIIFLKPWNNTKIGRFTICVAVFILPLFSSITGHAFAQENYHFLRMFLDWVHAVAVGVWTGGLFALFVWLGRRIKSSLPNSTISYQVVKRFSHFAMISTGAIFLAGVTMAYLNGVDPLHPFLTAYSQLVSVKLILFFLALSVAAINQFIHLKKGFKEQELKFVQNIRREVGLEIGIVFFIFVIAGFLSRTDLPLV